MTLIIGETQYLTGPVPFQTVFDGERVMFISEEPIRVTILCEHCKNFRLDQEVLYSVEELVERGWIVPLEVANG